MKSISNRCPRQPTPELLSPFVYPPFTGNIFSTLNAKPSGAVDARPQRARDRTWDSHLGEEFIGYATRPLEMLKNKLGTIARPGWQIMTNDAGFGRKIYDPTADTPAKYLDNLGRVVAHLVKAQFPEGQISVLSDLGRSEGDTKLNVMQALGPVAGVTFSRGHPAGPASGEIAAQQERQKTARSMEMPDIRRQIERGDLVGASKVIANVLFDEAVAIAAANHRVGQVHVFDLGLQLASIMFADPATEDHGDLLGCPIVRLASSSRSCPVPARRWKTRLSQNSTCEEEQPMRAAGLLPLPCGKERGKTRQPLLAAGQQISANKFMIRSWQGRIIGRASPYSPGDPLIEPFVPPTAVLDSRSRARLHVVDTVDVTTYLAHGTPFSL